MKLRFSEPAIQSLTAIRDYIAKDSPASAARVASAILESALLLKQFPQSGRRGRLKGTREILILSVIHTSRKWPKKL